MLLYNRDRNWYQPYCCGSSGWYCRLMLQRYEVCSNSIRIGIVMVVHWVECVCNQSWHVRTCLSNSWRKLQMAAFAQLTVVVRGNNTCVYVIAIFYDVWKYRTTHLHQVLFENRKNRNGNVSIIAASTRWRWNGSYTIVWLVPSI